MWVNVKINPAVYSDIQRFGSITVSSAAKIVADELTEEARSAIAEFYAWSPKMYGRSGSLNRSYKRYYRNHGLHANGGVQLLPDSVSEHPSVHHTKSMTGSYIFNLAYSGMHGNTPALTQIYPNIKNFPPLMKPSPSELLDDKYNNIIDNGNSYAYLGVDDAMNAGGYSVIRFG